MEFVDLLALVVLVCIGAAGVVGVITHNQNQRLRANSAPEAGVSNDDSPAEVRAKNRNYHMVTEAVRIFGEIHHQDSILPFLSERTRADIEEFLSNFYGNPK